MSLSDLLSVEEIDRLILDHSPDDDWYWWQYEAGNAPVEVEGLGTVAVVDAFGGGEGSGEEMYIVFRVCESSPANRWNQLRYFRKDGYYASFGGSAWDGEFREVRPTRHNVIIYEEM